MVAQRQTDTDTSWREFRAKFQTALDAHLGGNSAAFQALWSHGPDVCLMGAAGGVQRGWDDVKARLDWASSVLHAGHLTLENILTVVGTDIAATADHERMMRTVDGRQVPRVLRCTQLYRLEGGEWRIFHRHAEEM